MTAEQTQKQCHELELLQAEQEEKQILLAEHLEPALEDAQAKLEAAKQEVEGTRQRVNALYEKQGRSAQFTSAEERDAQLTQDIASRRGTRRSSVQRHTNPSGSDESRGANHGGRGRARGLDDTV